MDASLPVPFVIWVFLFLSIFLVALSTYRLFFHPLSKFPGPKLAAITRYYEAYYDLIRDGQYTNKIQELHKKYGPIVRISPHELHVADATFFQKLYRFDGQWEKHRFAYDAFAVPDTTICTIGHEAHKHRRASISPFLSKMNVNKRQDTIQQVASKLYERLDEAASTGALMNLGAAMSAFTADVATAVLLGKPYNNLHDLDFNKDLTGMLQSSGAVWRLSKFFRWYMPLMKSLPESFTEKMDDPGLKAFLAFVKETNRLVSEIVQTHSKAKEGQGEDEPRTLVNQILESNLPDSDKEQKRLEDEIGTIMGAAFETTAFSLRVTLYYIYTTPGEHGTPSVLTKLRSELSSLTTAQFPPIADLERLPYLTACLMEGLRFSPGLGTRMARICPNKPLTYGEYEIPPGTPVGMTQILMHMDENVFPNPKVFDPDRWLDEENRRGLEKVHAPFSRGTRMCLGMHLAWLELYTVVAAVVRRYDFDLSDMGLKDVECVSDQFGIGTRSKNGYKTFVTRHMEHP